MSRPTLSRVAAPMRSSVLPLFLALLVQPAAGQDFAGKSLLDLYPLPIEGKRWANCELPITVDDFHQQPRLILIVPKKAAGGDAIAGMVEALLADFGDKGLVVYAATDAKHSDDEKLAALGLAGLPVLGSASKVVRSYKVKKQAVAYLQGNHGLVIWEGNSPPEQAMPEGLKEAIEGELSTCQLAPTLRPLDDKLAGVAELVRRKRFVELGVEMKRLRKKKALREDLDYVSEQLDRFGGQLNEAMVELWGQDRPIEAMEIGVLFLWGTAVFGEAVLKEHAKLTVDWKFGSDHKKAYTAAVRYVNAESVVRSGNLKQALGLFQELAGSSGDDSVDRAAYRRVKALKKALGKK